MFFVFLCVCYKLQGIQSSIFEFFREVWLRSLFEAVFFFLHAPDLFLFFYFAPFFKVI